MYQIGQDGGNSDFILVSRNTMGPSIFVECHRMSGKLGCRIAQVHSCFKGFRNILKLAILELNTCSNIYFKLK
jgi:hypothetical protein